jgi:hypothetical protein
MTAWTVAISVVGALGAGLTVMVGLRALTIRWRLREDLTKDVGIRAALRPQSGVTAQELDKLILERGKRLVMAEHRRPTLLDRVFWCVELLLLTPGLLIFLLGFYAGLHGTQADDFPANDAQRLVNSIAYYGNLTAFALMVVYYFAYARPRQQRLGELASRLASDQIVSSAIDPPADALHQSTSGQPLESAAHEEASADDVPRPRGSTATHADRQRSALRNVLRAPSRLLGALRGP